MTAPPAKPMSHALRTITGLTNRVRQFGAMVRERDARAAKLQDRVIELGAARELWTAAAKTLADQIEIAEAERDRLREVAIEFCRRVDAGEVRSTKTYAAFKAALAPAAPVGQPENIVLHPKVALDFLDAQAEKWDAEVNLLSMATAIYNKPNRRERIVALARQSFVEGAYRAACEMNAVKPDRLAALEAVAVDLCGMRGTLAWAKSLMETRGQTHSAEQINKLITHADALARLDPPTQESGT